MIILESFNPFLHEHTLNIQSLFLHFPKILIPLSGGFDSTLLAYLMKDYNDLCEEQRELGKLRRELEYKQAVLTCNPRIEIKQSLTPETKAQCEALGRAMAERLKNL